MKIWVRLLVTGGLLLLLLVVLPWDTVRSAIARVPLSLWSAVLAGFVAGHLLGIVKWRVLVNAGRRKLRMSDAARCYAAGLFANLCLPSIVGGDVLRAALAARATGSPEAAILGGVVDRTIDVATLGILIAGGGVFARNVLPGWGGDAFNITLIAIAVVLLVFFPLAIRRPLMNWPRGIRRRVGRGLVALRSLARRPGRAVVSLVLSITIQSFFILLNVSLGRAVGVDVPLPVWFVVWPLAKAAGLLPISLGGLVVRDATFAALLVPLGVPIAVGVVASLIWQSVMIVGGLLAGVVWWTMARNDKAGSIAARLRSVSAIAPSRPSV